jgi:hypothetical protein
MNIFTTFELINLENFMIFNRQKKKFSVYFSKKKKEKRGETQEVFIANANNLLFLFRSPRFMMLQKCTSIFLFIILIR